VSVGTPYLWQRWLRRGVFWLGAILVSVVAMVFAYMANAADGAFHSVSHARPWAVLVICPLGFALSAFLTKRFFPGAQGSGIPQVIAAVDIHDAGQVRFILSLRLAFAKLALTVLGLASGASIGREGPTVQIGASLMRSLGDAAEVGKAEQKRALILAGGAAGVAAAFNTPLAGVVFAIEELSGSFEHRTSGRVLTAVIVAGIATTAWSGNVSYFGHTNAELPFGAAWKAVVACGVLGGVFGGGFAWLLIAMARGLPGLAGRLVACMPVVFAALCGLTVACIGLAAHGAVFGTGYAQARAMVGGAYDLPLGFFVAKLAATFVSYASGIPGGIFAPSLAVGAGLGRCVALLVPAAPAGAVVLLGMAAYFAGVVQAPITAAVIVMEMTDNQAMTIPLMAASFIAYGVSRTICRRPLYGALAAEYLRRVQGSLPAVSGLDMDEMGGHEDGG